MAETTTTKRLTSAMNRVSARTRIAIGLVFLLVSVLWLAMALGIVPSERKAAKAGRAMFCEAIAVNSSVFVERNDVAALDAALRAVVTRDPEILSAAARGEDGRVIVEIGDHAAHWGELSGEAAAESYVYVPIYANDRKWGTIEIRYQPLTRSGLIGYLVSPQARLIAFVAPACLGLFIIYLRKMLQHLDPSKVVPSRVRSALDTLAEGLVVLDNNERIVLANQAFASTVGRTPDDLLGSRASQLPWVGDGAARPADYPWLTSIRDGAPQRGVVMRMLDTESVRRTFTVNCSPVLGHDGEYRGVLVSFDDVTPLEQKEVELRKSKDAAEAYAAVAESANRAKSDFLARMSHEIRTPMNAILGFADVLRRGFEQSREERQEYLDTIHSSGQHLLELINDILDLSKIEAGKLEIEHSRCSPHHILNEAAAVLSVRAKQKGIALLVEWDGPAPETIESDPTRLRQVITNLVGNAIKFTETGSVRLVARLLHAGSDSKLAIDVIDTGIGMKPDVLGRIFQPFSQADTSITRRFGGTGLGLSISKEIAEALGGELIVSSEFGKGSTFSLTINTGPLDGVRLIDPESVEPSSQAPETKQDLPVHLPATTRILLVEDGASNRKLISLVLQRAGATVEAAEDGQAGAEMAMRGGYDLVLMDMQMPVMDGYTAASLLRRQGFTVPIIALTAHAMRGDEEKCRAAGCSGFLTKPIDMDLLVRTVYEAIGKPQSPAAPATGERAAAPLVPAPRAAAPGGRTMLTSSLPADDPEFCQIILEFIERFHQQLDAMQQAWSDGDLARLAGLAHWVKGSGGTAGFPALTEPARLLEHLARESRLDEIAGAIGSLRDLADRIAPPAPPPSPIDAAGATAGAQGL